MTTYDFGDGNGPVAAHKHPNGGGWVADTAQVDETAYVGGFAKVCGNAEVFDSARVYGDVELVNDSPTTPTTSDSPSYDPVEKPEHYNTGGIECIDYIKQVLGIDGFIAYCHGNMIKYQHRYQYKNNPVEDMKKAEWYLKKMNEALKEKYE